jgi:hypothetical protein
MLTTMKSNRFMLRAVRVLGLFSLGVWGWYLSAMFRTSGWGYDNLVMEVLKSFMTFCFFALPIAFLPLIGVSWPRKLLALAILSGICMLAVEAFARGQEYLLIHRLAKHPKENYTETRWWPFEHHSLGFVQGQWWGCD